MTVYAHIENNEITGVYDTLPANWRNISNFAGLIDETELLYSLGWRTIVKDNPVLDEYQRLGNPTYSIVDDAVVETIDILNLPRPVISEPVIPIPLTEEQLLEQQQIQHAEAMNLLRFKRDELLSATDFTQLIDVVQNNGEALTLLYQEYRQALRDLPTPYENDPTFIDESIVVYPTEPGVV